MLSKRFINYWLKSFCSSAKSCGDTVCHAQLFVVGVVSFFISSNVLASGSHARLAAMLYASSSCFQNVASLWLVARLLEAA